MDSREKTADATDPPSNVERDPDSTSLDRDVAVRLVGEHGQDIDPEVETKVLGKIDRFLIPAMIVGAYQVHFLQARSGKRC